MSILENVLFANGEHTITENEWGGMESGMAGSVTRDFYNGDSAVEDDLSISQQEEVL